MQTSENTPLKKIPRPLWLMVIVYSGIMIVFGVIKWRYWLYDGFDLAIFDQVLWNTAHGRFFAYSFNPYSYLVDHREWILLALAPFYRIAPHPLTLIVLQTFVLASGVFPLYRLARRILPRSHRRLGLAFCGIYLLHPTLQMMNLFEFHILPFIIPTTFWLWDAVLAKQPTRAIMIFALLLLIRDDVALMTIGVGLLLLFHRRMKFGACMVVVSALWLFIMTRLGAWLAPEGTTKFFIFYEWLGATPREVVQTIIYEPWRVITTFFGNDHAIIAPFLLGTVAFLPLAAPIFLLPLAGPLAAQMLIDRGIQYAVLNTHHGAFAIPWLFIASLYGISWLQKRTRHEQRPIQNEFLRLLPIMAGIMIVAQWVFIGPLQMLLPLPSAIRHNDVATFRSFVRAIPEQDRVFATERAYPTLAHRENLFPVMNAFVGKQHYSHLRYVPPSNIDWVVLENSSLLLYTASMPPEDRQDAYLFLRQVIDEKHLIPLFHSEHGIVYGPPDYENRTPIEPEIVAPQTDPPPTILTVHDEIVVREKIVTPEKLMLTLARIPRSTPTLDDYHLELQWKNIDGKILKTQFFAIGLGTDPTHSWEPGTPNRLTFPFTSPREAARLDVRIGTIALQRDRSFFLLARPNITLDPQTSATLTLPLVDEELDK